MSKRVQKKLDRMKPEPRKLICYLRGYDSLWCCHTEKVYKDSTKAEKECDYLNRDPSREYSYRVECE